MTGDVIDGRISGKYTAFVECREFYGDFVGEFSGAMDVVFLGRGEIQTEMGREVLNPNGGERQLQGKIEGFLEGELKGQFRGEFDGTLQGKMHGRLEPL